VCPDPSLIPGAVREAMARAEFEESLAALAARIPQLQLEQAPTIKGHTGIRRVAWMPGQCKRVLLPCCKFLGLPWKLIIDVPWQVSHAEDVESPPIR
jgi:hypothetical protein